MAMFRYLLLLAAIFSTSDHVAWGQASKSATIAQLLAIGWETKPDARQQAEEAYRRAVEDLPGDRTVVYAYALVKLQQRQYSEAAKLLDQYLAIEKTDAFAWRAKAWVSMLTKNATGSVAEMDKVSQLLADRKNKLTEEQQQELSGFLGRMIGFLEGPGEGSINAATLAATKKKFSERLTETQREAFDSGLSAVADEFGVHATAKDDAQAQEITTAEKLKREQLEQLDKDEVAIGARKEELKLAAQKVESEAQAENATYAKADQPFADNLSRLSAQAAAIDRDLSIVSSDIVAVRAQLAREKDPVLRDRYFNDLNRLQVLASRLDGDLAALEGRASTVQSQRAALAARHNQAQAGFARSLALAQKEFLTLENREKRADAQRNKLKKPAAGNTGKVISLNKQAIALTTYESFPLEAEKQRLLDGLDGK
jgi:hypothetical protein